MQQMRMLRDDARQRQLVRHLGDLACHPPLTELLPEKLLKGEICQITWLFVEPLRVD
jgi:hypothetical protein